ncbi:amidohydrolase family protein [Croceicoccus sp. BE223]|uniref:N-acyl-D-amino-acid deacylase family protein n=1 Tax=Croceicoccus sp. BE223 TaxID=2817716 RepID=UPI002856F8E4|nr:amidohydrolase family protein [Croceicoccus sp. BE223]MDR7101357.1 N-acyl-D-aspartate/D-glutamate deacylase [Croceicoccus sp. BE223]
MLDLLIRGGQVADGTGAAIRTADVGVKDGRIVEVGRIGDTAHRTVDADGLLVTPGWVDIHTHYDGQATWDPVLDPSFSSGVTTAILGNCGVGFAPVHRGDEARLIDLMDGVEEIPGSALHAGLKWNWSSFPEYLDVLDAQARSFDIGAYLPHGPLRLFVLGDKVGTEQPASDEEIAAMARITDAAMQAGAFGLSSSRTSVHRTVRGDMTPDFGADQKELMALAREVARHGGVMEFAPAGVVGEDPSAIRDEMAMFDRIVRETGVDVHMLMLQPNLDPDYWQSQLEWAGRINAGGRSRAFGQVSGRSIGALLSFFGTHPFMERPSFRAIKAQFPREAWLEKLADPEVKARILAETDPEGSFGQFLNSHWERCYDLGEQADYEPDEAMNVVGLARASGRTVQSYAYDTMLTTSRHPRLLLAINNYVDGGLERMRPMLEHPASVLGASDAGAHVMTICDGSMNSFMLTHWARDRRRGPTMPVEQVVRMMSRDTARSMGIRDRGTLEPGMRADINLIDFANLTLGKPTIVDDLPEGASRLLQDVRGFQMTVVGGTVTREDDSATGALPGRVLRHRGRG